jgi:hypothetical protein
MDKMEKSISIGTEEDLQEFAEQAQVMADEKAIEDMASQLFFRVVGTNHVVQSEEEFNAYVKAGIRTELVNYGQAVDSVNKEVAEFRAVKAKKRARKKARASRRRNR